LIWVPLAVAVTLAGAVGGMVSGVVALTGLE
jgi:hypothetical protein